MENKYYTPTLDQFVQGFKFEKLEYTKGTKLGGMFFMDPEYNAKHGKSFYAEEDKWVEITVWWDKKPEWTTVDYGDISVTSTAYPEFDWLPWTGKGYIQKLIDDGKVRAKR